MNKQISSHLIARLSSSTLLLFTVLLSACQPQTPTVDPDALMTQAVQTAFASIQQTKPAATPTRTPLPTPTLPLTPPALPDTFTTTALNPLDTPHTYINDECQYLKARWTSTNAAPGTIVMVIMFHTISKSVASTPNEIGNQDFQNLMNDLHGMGFQAINTQQLAGFLYSNTKIPQRSTRMH